MFANARVLISRRHIVRMRMIIIHQQPHHLADQGGHSGSRAGLVRYVFLKFLKFQFKNKTNKKRKKDQVKIFCSHICVSRNWNIINNKIKSTK